MSVVAELRAQGMAIPVTTVDLGIAAAIELAKGDIIKGIAAQRPFDQGEAEADAALLSLLDKPVPAWVALPGLPVTQANVIEAFEAIWHTAAPPALIEAHRDATPAPERAHEAPVTSAEVRPEVPVVELRSVHNDRLNGVDLAVRAGQIVGLAGMVGSGRTEILQTIFGLRPVKGGELLIDGSQVSVKGPRDAIRRGMALVPENRHVQGLVLEHSIERNVAMPRIRQLGHLGIFRRSASFARAQEAMDLLSIRAPGPATQVRALSGGNQQKVVFGKWRDPTPVILLLDEPTIGVDVGARDQIYELVRSAALGGAAVVIVSSELGELVALCDRIAIVVDGQVRMLVSKAEIPNEEHLHRLVQEA
jgi:ribose transport system ATP-binding protein